LTSDLYLTGSSLFFNSDSSYAYRDCTSIPNSTTRYPNSSLRLTRAPKASIVDRFSGAHLLYEPQRKRPKRYDDEKRTVRSVRWAANKSRVSLCSLFTGKNTQQLARGLVERLFNVLRTCPPCSRGAERGEGDSFPRCQLCYRFDVCAVCAERETPERGRVKSGRRTRGRKAGVS
jgi:hypothetical protein